MLKKKINQHLIRTPLELDLLKICKFLRINSIKGDYVEFGVAAGDNIVRMANMSSQAGYKFDKYFGFDTFEGMPEAKGIDKTHKRGFNEFKFTESYVSTKLNKNKVNHYLVKGLFKDTVKDMVRVMNKSACIYIDCDYYESTRDILKHIKPLLQKGTVIVFADWYCFNGDDKKGERKAYYDWMFQKSNKINTEELTSNDLIKIFIVKEV